MTDYETWLIDEQIEVYRRMIAMHRKKILELSRSKNEQKRTMTDLGMDIKNG